MTRLTMLVIILFIFAIGDIAMGVYFHKKGGNFKRIAKMLAFAGAVMLVGAVILTILMLTGVLV